MNWIIRDGDRVLLTNRLCGDWLEVKWKIENDTAILRDTFGKCLVKVDEQFAHGRRLCEIVGCELTVLEDCVDLEVAMKRAMELIDIEEGD